MTIQEVWDRLGEIHATIFSDAERVLPYWLEVCSINSTDSRKRTKFFEQKSVMMSRPINTIRLQDEWLKCFKSEKLEDARLVLLYMAMFMIFGALKMVDNLDMVESGEAESMVSNIKGMSHYRRWAMGICLRYGIANIVSNISCRKV